MGLLALLFGGDDLIPHSLKKHRKPFVPYTNAKKRKPFFTRKRLKKTWQRVTFKKTRRNIKRAHRTFKQMRREYRFYKSQNPKALAHKRGLARAHQRPVRRRSPVRH